MLFILKSTEISLAYWKEVYASQIEVNGDKESEVVHFKNPIMKMLNT